MDVLAIDDAWKQCLYMSMRNMSNVKQYSEREINRRNDGAMDVLDVDIVWKQCLYMCMRNMSNVKTISGMRDQQME